MFPGRDLVALCLQRDPAGMSPVPLSAIVTLCGIIQGGGFGSTFIFSMIILLLGGFVG